MAAALLVLGTLKFIGRRLLRAIRQLVVKWVEKDLDKRVRVVTVQLVLAVLPAAIVAYVRASLRVIEEEIWRPSKVLLPVRVVALGPVVDSRVANGAE